MDAAREFVRVCIYNNKKGYDEKILKRYREPSWNNPVIRYVDAAGKDLLPRKDRVWSTGGTLQRMAAALRAAEREVPVWLGLVANEYAPKSPEVAVFAMACYWVGEQKLGAIEGVIGTRIGSLHGAEVVEVTFDSSRLTYEALTRQAAKLQCATRVFARTKGQALAAETIVGRERMRLTDEPVDTTTTQQYHLSKRPAWNLVPLTALQATRLNAAIASGKDPSRWCSPGQLALQKRIAKGLRTREQALKALKPDRTDAGLPAYLKKLEKALSG